jgi:hypothetical protein
LPRLWSQHSTCNGVVFLGVNVFRYLA